MLAKVLQRNRKRNQEDTDREFLLEYNSPIIGGTHNIALQSHVSFCCATKWSSHTYAPSPSLLSLPSTLPSHASRLSQSTGRSSLCYTSGLPWLFSWHRVVYTRLSGTHSLCHPLRLHPRAMSAHPVSRPVSLFLPCKCVHMYHFTRLHIHVLIDNVCLPFWLLSRSIYISAKDPVSFLLMAE